MDYSIDTMWILNGCVFHDGIGAKLSKCSAYAVYGKNHTGRVDLVRKSNSNECTYTTDMNGMSQHQRTQNHTIRTYTFASRKLAATNVLSNIHRVR